MRIGTGYDVHRLTEGRKCIIGGVEIPYEKGLLGHSDADVLLHAIMDALLGAAALGDIGKHFPDSDPAYKGISSVKLLEHVAKLLGDNLFLVENIDATIIAQAPKMRPHIEKMRENIAGALGIERPPRRGLVLPEMARAFPLRRCACSQVPETSTVRMWQRTAARAGDVRTQRKPCKPFKGNAKHSLNQACRRSIFLWLF